MASYVWTETNDLDCAFLQYVNVEDNYKQQTNISRID